MVGVADSSLWLVGLRCSAATWHRSTFIRWILSRWWQRHDHHHLLRTEDVHLHTPALQIGTHFLLTLETVVFLFHLLSIASKHFSSLSTRLEHAARLGFFYKMRYINSPLLLVLLVSEVRKQVLYDMWISAIKNPAVWQVNYYSHMLLMYHSITFIRVTVSQDVAIHIYRMFAFLA